MRNSQYLEDYLECNDERGEGKGLTIGSYLAGVLRGKAKQYSSGYHRALEASCKRVGARLGDSYAGRDAYYPPVLYIVSKPVQPASCQFYSSGI
jgi:hypothetical protein